MGEASETDRRVKKRDGKKGRREKREREREKFANFLDEEKLDYEI